MPKQKGILITKAQVLEQLHAYMKLQKENAELKEQLRAKQLEIERLQPFEHEAKELRPKAFEDVLTGLQNRRAFDGRSKQMFADARRHGSNLCLAMCDIDHFKSVNDTYGHQVGDLVLMKMGELLSRHCRESDFVARIGGEEFGILLSHTDRDAAYRFIKRLHQIIEESLEFLVGEKTVRCTACFGIGELTTNVTSVDELIKRADDALYAAKKNGRNQVALA